jgi:uncharacterized protein YjbI with pentapeptide repeats
MKNLIHLQKTFEKTNPFDNSISNQEFEECVFLNCDISNAVLSNATFMDCVFKDCNLSMTRLASASLKGVHFKNCKLLGILFDECDDFLFQVEFEECVLDYASFTNKKMPKTKFISCSLKEVNFSETNLTGTIFDGSTLQGALFNNTQLAGSDFTKATDYSIDPEYNPMKKAKFSTQGIGGLLDKYDIKIH